MPGKNDVSLENKNHIIIGTSGSGKSTWLKQQINKIKPSRLLVWDPDQEYKVNHFHKISGLAGFLKDGHKRKFRIGLAVDPTPANFDMFCRIAFSIASSNRPVMIVIEELADVTTVSKASPAWGQLCRRGRKYGVVLFAVTQRPAECDKTIYSQAPFKWVGYLDNETDQKRMSSQLGVTIDQVKKLEPLQYLYKKPGPGAPDRGKVVIRQR